MHTLFGNSLFFYVLGHICARILFLVSSFFPILLKKAKSRQIACFHASYANWNRIPATAEIIINTIGWRFFVAFTRLVNNTNPTARSNPFQLSSASPAGIIKRFRITPFSEILFTLVNTSRMTATHAAPINPVEAGRKP